MNRVTLIGNLGRDPEIRRLENGAAVGKNSRDEPRKCRFSAKPSRWTEPRAASTRSGLQRPAHHGMDRGWGRNLRGIHAGGRSTGGDGDRRNDGRRHHGANDLRRLGHRRN